MPNQLRQAGKKIFRAKDNFVVFRVNVLGDSTGIRQFAVFAFGIAYREGLNGFFSQRSHHRGDGTGIESSAQENAQWNIAHEMSADCVRKQVAEMCYVVGLTEWMLGQTDIQVPVLSDLGLGVFGRKIKAQAMAWKELVHVLIKRFVRREIAKSKKLR